MNSNISFWLNSPLSTAIIAWFIAQFIKVLKEILFSKKIDFRRFVGSGGMPSSHSAIVTALATSIGFCDGFRSSTFAITVIFSLIVMYDAAGVRRAAGQQAKILNKIVDDWGHASVSDTEKKLKELIGHTPKEVFVGALLGIVVAVLRYF